VKFGEFQISGEFQKNSGSKQFLTGIRLGTCDTFAVLVYVLLGVVATCMPTDTHEKGDTILKYYVHVKVGVVCMLMSCVWLAAHLKVGSTGRRILC